jgi:hypothetical protein
MRTTLRRCININNGYAPYPPVAFPAPITYGALDNPPGVPLNPGYPSIIAASIRLTTLLDDMTFDNSGQPAVPANQVDRGGRYNVAWLIRRPRQNVPDEVDLKVLVYAGRSPTDTPSPEHVFANATTAPGQKLISIPLGGNPPPPLRKGGWIAFSRVIPPVIDPVSGQPTTTMYPTLDFYRVAGVNDDAADPLLVELESPIRSEGDPLPPAPPPANYLGTVVVFENLIEVFDRGMVSASGGMGGK